MGNSCLEESQLARQSGKAPWRRSDEDKALKSKAFAERREGHPATGRTWSEMELQELGAGSERRSGWSDWGGSSVPAD